jgi:HlyD family secretion protein
VISAENPGEILLPGMTANLEAVVARRQGVLKIPNAALRYRPPDQLAEQPSARLVANADAAEHIPAGVGALGRVFVIDGGQRRPVPLRLGITDGRMTEVIAGDLAAGHTVITGMAPSIQGDQAPGLAKFRLR